MNVVILCGTVLLLLEGAFIKEKTLFGGNVLNLHGILLLLISVCTINISSLLVDKWFCTPDIDKRRKIQTLKETSHQLAFTTFLQHFSSIFYLSVIQIQVLKSISHALPYNTLCETFCKPFYRENSKFLHSTNDMMGFRDLYLCSLYVIYIFVPICICEDEVIWRSICFTAQPIREQTFQ